MSISLNHDALFYRSKDKTITWSTEPPVTSIETDTRTMFQGSAKLKGHAVQFANTPEDCFDLFFTPDMINQMVHLTNENIENVNDAKTDLDHSPTGEAEMKAFLGVLIVSGLYLYENVRELWETTGFGIEIIRSTLSSNRFFFILKHFQYVKEETVTDVSCFMDLFSKNCKDNFELSSYATLEDQHIPFRGETPIRATTDKKIGIRLISVRDSRVNYTHNCVLYQGDRDIISLVSDVTRKLRGPDRLIVSDKRFTSASLVNHFSSHNTFFLGEIKKKSQEIPAELMFAERPDKSTNYCLFNENMTLICHGSRDEQDIFLMSNLRGIRQCLPDMLETYDALANQTNVVDAMCRNYSCAKRTKRWVLAIFFRLIDIACINAQVIYSANDPTDCLSRRNFIKKLSGELVRPHLIVRSQITSLPCALRQSAAKIANVSFTENSNVDDMIPQGRMSKRRCQYCPKDKECKSPYYCQGCKRCICRKRAFLFCKDCVNLNNDPQGTN